MNANAKIDTHRGENQRIEDKHIPLLREVCHISSALKFRGDALNITEQDEMHKRQVLAFCRSRLIGLDGMDRSRHPEIYEHDNLKELPCLSPKAI